MAKVPDYMDMNGCTFQGEYFHPKYMEDPHWKTYEKEIMECLSVGMRPRPAFRAAGLHEWLYHDWSKRFPKEIEKGVTDSPFVLFMLRMAKESEYHHKTLLKKANEIALEGEGNPKMIQYLLDTTKKYARKQEVEVSTAEDTTFQINIIDSTPKE